MGLGRLRRVADPRDVWPSEAGSFTPWLADNLDVLADELGMSFTLVGSEIPVGDFRLDIQAETPDGRTVIIENQLERTDHGHLGQLVVYASGLEAASVVWVAPAFREDHRRALDWLNERTDTGVDFFGVEVSVVQIGDTSARAPVFDVVARPNGWQKQVKQEGKSTAAPTTSLNEARQTFFLDVLADVTTERPAIRLPTRSRAHWLSFASGPWGSWDFSCGRDGRLRVEAYIDSGDAAVNLALFEQLQGEAAQLEQRVGHPVSWEPLESRRACRVAVYFPLHDPSDPDETRALKPRVAAATVAMYDMLNDQLRQRVRELRQSPMTSAGKRTAGAEVRSPVES